MPAEDRGMTHALETQALEAEIEAELALVRTSSFDDRFEPPTQWPFDPADVDREQVGLQSLLGAVELSDDSARPGSAGSA